MPVIREGHIEFAFDDRHWPFVRKWDEHQHHLLGLGRQAQGTRAVDMVGLHISTTAWFFEMKDFRGHRIENRGRVGKDLANEVATKFRDTLASMIWAHGRAELEADPKLSQLLREVFRKTDKPPMVRLVVWVDEDRPILEYEKLEFEELVKRELRPWIQVRVVVTNVQAWNNDHDLVPRNLAGVGRP